MSVSSSPRGQEQSPRISQILAINTHRSVNDQVRDKVRDKVKEKVKEKLVEDAEFLLEKKRREDEKRDRVRKMEEEFEKNRQNKVKMLNQKEIKSEEVIGKNKEEISKRIKLQADYFKQKVDKIEHDNEQEIRKALHQRQQLSTRKANSSFSKTSKDHSFHHMVTQRASTRVPPENVDAKIQIIMNRVNKAQRIREEANENMVNRMREMTKGIPETQKRALSNSLLEESEILRSYYHKTEELHRIASSSKGKHEKQILQKRRSVKEKLDKCSQNLKHLSEQHEEKLQQLQAKFIKKTEPKQWKDARLEKYKQKWQQNSRRIQFEKQEKANQILQKHEEITQQNRIYKQQKDKLIQAVKHNN